MVTKSKRILKNLINANPNLSKAVKKIFNTKTLKVATGATAISVAAAYITDYIKSNSGCFLKGSNSVCKMRLASCCQMDKVDGVPFCDESHTTLTNVCEGYDENTEKDCCKLCDCQYFDCLPNQTMECQTPTVGEALTHFTQTLVGGTLSTIFNTFPWLLYIVYFIGSILLLWCTSLIYTFFKK